MDGTRHGQQRVATAGERRPDSMRAVVHDHLQLSRHRYRRHGRPSGGDRQRNHLRDRGKHRPRPDLEDGSVHMNDRQTGFTMLEVVIAMMLLAIGLVGAAAIAGQVNGGVTSAATMGLGAITRSNNISTATMLAQEKLEQLKEDAQWSGGAISASTGCGGTVSGN